MRPAESRPPDRVPVMCQLALGHYFLHAGADPIDIWHDSEAFAAALVTMQRRYGFDGIQLMAETGTDGIDTLDPPPLGNVDLAEARRRLPERVFIKGNVDPVNTLLRRTPDECYRDARARIAAAGRAGYVLSSACSVSPRTPPANVLALARAAEDTA